MDEMRRTHGKRLVVASSLLPQVRELLAKWPQLATSLRLPPTIHAVVDTSAIIADVRFIAKNQSTTCETALLEVLKSGIVVGHFPTEAVPELDAKLTEIAQRYGLPRDLLETTCGEYRKHLTIEPSGGETADQIAIRDPSDAPFVRLHKKIGAHMTLTCDNDFAGSGINAVTPLAVRIDLRDLARATALHSVVMVSSATITGAALIGLVGILKALSKAPRHVLMALGTLAIAVAFVPNVRSKVWSELEPIRSGLAKVWATIGPAICELLQHAEEAKAEGMALSIKLSTVIPAYSEEPIVTPDRPMMVRQSRLVLPVTNSPLPMLLATSSRRTVRRATTSHSSEKRRRCRNGTTPAVRKNGG
jgi:hypothetical protein